MSYLPEKGAPHYPSAFGEKPELGKATLRQLEKDFALQGMLLTLPASPPPYAGLLALLAAFLRKHDLLHSPLLARILYQLDMDEAQMHQKIAHTPPDEMYHMTAHEMLMRCFAKVLFRQRYSSKP
jgi:hypothetical protein